MMNGNSLIEDTVFTVFDVETTGLDPEKDRIVEVASVAVWGSRVLPGEYASSLVNPGIPIPPSASAIHHLTDSMVENAPTLAGAPFLPSPDIDYLPVAHNAAFDSAFLGDMGCLPDRWLCTKRLACHLWPGADSHSNQFLRYWLKLEVDLPEGLAPHRALADAWVTAHLLVREIEEAKRRGIKTVEDLLRLAETPIIQQKIRFGKYAGKLWSDLPIVYLQWMASKGGWDEATTTTLNHHLQARTKRES